MVNIGGEVFGFRRRRPKVTSTQRVEQAEDGEDNGNDGNGQSREIDVNDTECQAHVAGSGHTAAGPTKA